MTSLHFSEDLPVGRTKSGESEARVRRNSRIEDIALNWIIIFDIPYEKPNRKTKHLCSFQRANLCFFAKSSLVFLQRVLLIFECTLVLKEKSHRRNCAELRSYFRYPIWEALSKNKKVQRSLLFSKSTLVFQGILVLKEHKCLSRNQKGSSYSDELRSLFMMESTGSFCKFYKIYQWEVFQTY